MLAEYPEREIIKPHYERGYMFTHNGLEQVKPLTEIDLENAYEHDGLTDFEYEFMEDFIKKFRNYYGKYGSQATIFCSGKQLQVLLRIEKKVFGDV